MKTASGIIFSLICLLVIALLLSPSKVPTSMHSIHVKSFLNVAKIGRSIEAFQADHNGLLPDKITDLIPNYIQESDQSCILAPWVNTITTQEITKHPELYTNSGYVYLGGKGKKLGIILYEDFRLFTNNIINETNVVFVLSDGLSVDSLPTYRVQQLLKEVEKATQ